MRELFSSPEAAEGFTTDEAVREIARLAGFTRASARPSEVLRQSLRLAARRKIIAQERGTYFLLARSIEDYTRDELIEQLLAAIGRTWSERTDAIRLAARRLGFRRTGRRISVAFKSVINGAIRRGLLEYDGQLIRRTKQSD